MRAHFNESKLLLLVLIAVSLSNQCMIAAKLITCKPIHPQLINGNLMIGYLWLFDGRWFHRRHGWFRGQHLILSPSYEKMKCEDVYDAIMKVKCLDPLSAALMLCNDSSPLSTWYCPFWLMGFQPNLAAWFKRPYVKLRLGRTYMPRVRRRVFPMWDLDKASWC